MACPIGTDVCLAASLVKAGKLVAFATETVYGLGADALNPTAVAGIFRAKNRPKFDPLIVHIGEIDWVDRLADSVPDRAKRLAERFWPGPLTIVLPKRTIVPDLVTSGLSTVAVRMPDHALAVRLLREAGVPVAAPSANPFGRLSPTSAAHVAEMLGEQIDYILDGGSCRVGVESTVVQVLDDVGRVLLLRPGGVSQEDIEACVGRLESPPECAHPSARAQPAPGMLPRHYAPSTPLVVVDCLDSFPAGAERRGLLTLRAIADTSRFTAVEVLSASGDPSEAAAGFFSALRRLDAADVDVIVAIRFPEEGLGRALNDRLSRAAEKATG